MQMWPLVFAFLSSKVGHSALIAENSQSSMVMVLLLRLAKDGFFPSEVNCSQRRQVASGGGGWWWWSSSLLGGPPHVVLFYVLVQRNIS